MCAWCKTSMGQIEPIAQNDISHGICQKCLNELYKEIKIDETGNSSDNLDQVDKRKLA